MRTGDMTDRTASQENGIGEGNNWGIGIVSPIYLDRRAGARYFINDAIGYMTNILVNLGPGGPHARASPRIGTQREDPPLSPHARRILSERDRQDTGSIRQHRSIPVAQARGRRGPLQQAQRAHPALRIQSPLSVQERA